MDRIYKLFSTLLMCFILGSSSYSYAQSCYAAGSSLSFVASGETKTSTIQGGCSDGSSLNLQIGSKPNWIVSAYLSGNSSATVTATQNTGGSRSGSISLMRNGSQIGVISVSQAAGVALVGQVSFTSGTTQRCIGSGTSDYNASASNATSYSWSLSPGNAGSINSNGTVTWNSSFFGTATVQVTAYGANNSSSSATRSVSVVGVSTPGLQTDTYEICAGSTATFTLAPLEDNVKYELMLGATVVRTHYEYSSGSGVVIWTNINQGGNYTMRATRINSPTCSVDYGSLTIISKQGPGSPSITGSTQVCSSTNQTDYGISGGSSPNTYSWSILNGGAATINSSTGLVTWNGFIGTATIRLTATPECGNPINVNRSVTVTGVSTPGLQTDTYEICAGSTATFTLAPLEDNVKYELMLGATVVRTHYEYSSGSGAVVWANINQGGNYSMRATRLNSPICSAEYGSLTLVSKAGPGNPSITGSSQVCSSTDQTDYGISGGSTPNTYSWSILNAGAATINSSTGLVTWNGFLGTATIRLTATPECGNPIDVNRSVTVTGVSTPGLQTDTNEICAGSTATFTLAPLEVDVKYDLMLGTTVVRTHTETTSSGTGAVVWTNINQGGDYYIRATQVNSPGCLVEYGSVIITIKENLGNPVLNDPGDRCKGTGTTAFNVTSSSSNNTYLWSITNAGIQTTITGNGNSASVSWDGNFSGNAIVSVDITSECGATTTLSRTITVNEPITWYADADGDKYPDPGLTTQVSCEPPSTGTWVSDADRQSIQDVCPNYFNDANGSNGCNSDCLYSQCGGNPGGCPPFVLDPGSINFDSLGGTQTVTVQIGCTTGYNIEIEPISNNTDNWITVTLINGNELFIECQEGADYRETNVNVRVNGNSGGGVTVTRNDPGPDPPAVCQVNPISDIEFSPFADSQSITISYVDPLDCNGTVYLEHPYEDIPDWLQIVKSGLTFTLSVDDNTFGNTLNTLLIPVLDDGNGNRTPIGNAFYVTQTSCNTEWYLDSDNDGYGDVYGISQTNCYDPDTLPGDDPSTHWVSNNDDICPNDSSPGTGNGCPGGVGPENWNTITTTGFDINETLQSSTRVYFDEFSRQVQTQSLDKNTGRTWADATLYDDEGRPVLNTLSAPIRPDFSFLYKSDFIQNTSGGNYSSANLETTPENPDPVGTNTNSLGWYYSDFNTDSYYDGNSLRDITDRPYSRTIYSTLIPNQPLRNVGGNKVDTNTDGIITEADSWVHGYTFSMLASTELSHSGAFGNSAYDSYDILKTVSRDVHGNENVIFTDSDGKTLASARSGDLSISARTHSLDIPAQGYVDIHVPQGSNNGFTVSSSNVTVYDLITENTVSPSLSLSNGFYRVAVNNPDSYTGGITVTYKENYYDYALNYYDETGRLTHNTQPKGKDFETIFTYNSLGQLTEVTSPDEGTAQFKYRKDGQIRFSQNSEQALTGEFSYTNYDALGRPVESGVFTEGSITFANVDNILIESILKDITIDDDGLPNTSCSEQTYTLYEKEDLSGLHAALSASGISVTGYDAQRFISGNVSKTFSLETGNNTSTWYSYDVYGRTEWVVQQIEGLGAKTIHYEYEPEKGLVEKVLYQKDQPDQFVHRYIYDEVYQLVSVQTSTTNSSNPADWKTHATYEYFETGALKRKVIAGAQSVDYIYNLSGQLKAINPDLSNLSDSHLNNNDLFGMQLDYHIGDYKRSVPEITTSTYGQDQVNGNIKGIRWNNQYVQSPAEYTFSYDRNNWITGANFDPSDTSGGGTLSNLVLSGTITGDQFATESITIEDEATILPESNIYIGAGNADQAYDVNQITYDANGNILSLKRNKDNSGSGVAMDDLVYDYNDTVVEGPPNQLLSVTDGEGEVSGADDIGSSTTYQYNAIGQLTAEISNGITTSYFYDASGLVTEVTQNSLPVVKFYYNDRGHRVKKEKFDSQGNLFQTDYYVRDISGSIMAIYNNSSLLEQPIYGEGRLGIAYEGTNGSKTYVYELTDHLGNVRATFTESSGSASLGNALDFYPFGMQMPGRKNIVGTYRYTFQGQENDPETGKEAFELRLWDGRIGRWLTTDPANQYTSPYLGMGNNPINGIDPDGAVYNPVFGSDGTYRGNTKEGFKGEAIIYDGNLDFKNLSAKELTGSGGTFLSGLVFSNPGVRDKIEGFIVNYKLEDGLNLDKTVTIQNTVANYNYLANAADDKFTILRGVDKFGQSEADQYFEPTVENLRSLINGHEVTGHVIMDIGGSPAEHYSIHSFQVGTPQFGTTTNKFKSHVLSQMAIHAVYGGKVSDFKNNKTIYNLFNQYGRNIIQRDQPNIFNRFYK